MQITYFWTGAALNKTVDTMHMKLSDWVNELFIDTGWWMELMKRIVNGQEQVQHLYMTHCHSDHMIGFVHVLRAIKTRPLQVYCTETLEKKLETLMEIVGKWKYYKNNKENGNISINYITESSIFNIWNWIIQPVNLFSQKEEQHGFMLTQWDKKLVFFGDESVDILKRNDLEVYSWADWLLCESFCTHDHIELRKPYDKQHITARDAWGIATTLHVKNLILSHIDDFTDDRHLQLSDIKEDAQQTYNWNIIVPHDSQTIELW